VTVREEESASARADGSAGFHRILLKLSGEALMGDKEFGLDLPRIEAIAEEIVECQKTGVEIAIVVGAGNIYRGMAAAAEGMDRATADYAGMLATLLNALALQDVLGAARGAHAHPVRDRRGRGGRAVYPAPRDPPSREGADRDLRRRDRQSVLHRPTPQRALRALEVGADAILMAKNGVDGVYDADPRVEPGAELLPELTHLEAIERRARGDGRDRSSRCCM
jgi:uridylate kinase